jgi:dihydroorotate dehydrogenase
MGFNNLGVEHARRRLAARHRNGLVGANVGKNKETVDAASDFCIGVRALAPHADYLVVNISSPNTPGLRNLQRREEARALLAAVMTARSSVSGTAPPPLLVKLSPDLNERELEELVEVALAAGVDGLIVSNTTIARPAALGARWQAEAGGLSGRPLFAASTRMLAETYRLSQGRLPLIGVGGIASGADAYAKILAGASLVQLYTALVYRGPGLVARIKAELAECLTRDGFASVREAVGQGGGGGR